MFYLRKMGNTMIFLSLMTTSPASWGLETTDLSIENIRRVSIAAKDGAINFYSQAKENSSEITIAGAGIIIGGTLVNRLAKSYVQNSANKFGANVAKPAMALARYSNSLGGLKNAVEFVDAGTAMISDGVSTTRSAGQNNAMKIGLLGVKDWMQDHGFRAIQSISKWGARLIGTPVLIAGSGLWVLNSAATEAGIDEEASLEVMSDGETFQDYISNTPPEQVLKDTQNDPALKVALTTAFIVVDEAKKLDEEATLDPSIVSDKQGEKGKVQQFSTRAQVVLESNDVKDILPKTIHE